MATKQITSQTESRKPLTEEELNAQIALTGNLAGLSPAEQMSYYERYCRHLGLDPITRPFDLVTTFDENGVPKTILYANASCSSQLADNRQVTYGKPEIEHSQILGIVTIRVQAMMDGKTTGKIRSTWRSGVAHIDGLKGKRLENAIKKAETQAHRRATLALCGVAMPDESEIEDISGAQVGTLPPVQVDAAIGGIYDKIGELLRARKLEDSSGARRYILDGLVSGAYQGIAQMTGIPLTAIEDLARKAGLRHAPLQQAEQLKAHAEQAANDVRDLAEEISKPALDLRMGEAAERIVPSLGKFATYKPAPDPDPVPALTPTLTTAQQRVSDAVGLAWREHKKDKGVVLHLITQFIGRDVKRSAELTDEEAEKVFNYLQTVFSQWSAEAKAEPTKTVYDQKNRAHNADLADQIDNKIQKLTVLGMSAADISNLISIFIAGETFGRVIENRFELDDEEAKATIEMLRKKIEELEAAKAEIVAADA